MYRPGSVTYPTCGQVILLMAKAPLVGIQSYARLPHGVAPWCAQTWWVQCPSFGAAPHGRCLGARRLAAALDAQTVRRSGEMSCEECECSTTSEAQCTHDADEREHRGGRHVPQPA